MLTVTIRVYLLSFYEINKNAVQYLAIIKIKISWYTSRLCIETCRVFMVSLRKL